MSIDPILAQDSVLAEIVRRLVAEFAPARIYLFGSRARGDAGPDSDYDVMVLVREQHEPGYRLAQQAYRLLRGVPAAVDVLVWPQDLFERRRTLPASFAATIEREGRTLYAA